MTASAQPGPRAVARAFTLLELMVVIALIGLITASVVGVSVTMLRERPATGEEALRQAVAKARRQALTSGAEQWLSFDRKEKVFVLANLSGEQKLAHSLKGGLEVEFLPLAQGSTILLGGDLTETSTLAHVRFYPDGACSPFRAQIRTGGPARVVNFDPWTCAELRDEKAKP